MTVKRTKKFTPRAAIRAILDRLDNNNRSPHQRGYKGPERLIAKRMKKTKPPGAKRYAP